MNDIKIKVNGMEISLENSSPIVGNVALDTSADLDNMSAMLARESEDLSKQIKAVSLLSDIKTVESFGYKATEGVMNNIGKAAGNIANKIIEFFKKIINTISEFINKKMCELQISAANKKLEKIEQNAGIFTVKISAAAFEKATAKRSEAMKVLEKYKEVDFRRFMGVGNSLDEAIRIIEALDISKFGVSFSVKKEEYYSIKVEDMRAIINDAKSNVSATTDALKTCKSCAEIAKKKIEAFAKKNANDKQVLKAANAVVDITNTAISAVFAYYTAITKFIVFSLANKDIK